MLNYELIDNNKKEYIVLLHGYGGNCKCFKKQLDTLSKFFNVLLIDMHGHGKSAHIHLEEKSKATLKNIADDIDKTLQGLDIRKAHFMGLSLGTIVTNVYACYYPENVLSILNAGAVIKFKPFVRHLLNIIYEYRNLFPQNFLYSMAGLVVMPQKSHKISRQLFVREAKKMNRLDFYRWGRLLVDFQEDYDLTKIKFNSNTNILYVSGKEDYFFIKEVEKYCKDANMYFYRLKNAGHICNIDNYKEFNVILEKYYSHIFNNCIDIK